MNLDEFKSLLKKAGFSKKTFSEDVEIALSTVNGWGSSNKPPVPFWVEKYLNLYIENKDCKELKEIIRANVCKE
ncbi:XRE family transcriptional regulator [Sulfurimonas sp.]